MKITNFYKKNVMRLALQALLTNMLSLSDRRINVMCNRTSPEKQPGTSVPAEAGGRGALDDVAHEDLAEVLGRVLEIRWLAKGQVVVIIPARPRGGANSASGPVHDRLSTGSLT